MSYANNKKVGTATVTVAGAGIWTGEASTTFKIAAKKAAPTVTLSPAKCTCDGKAKTPKVTVKDGGEVLVAGQDYDVAFPSGRVNAGSYTVKVTLKGNYFGSASAAFTIAKAPNTLTAKGKTVKLKASKLKKKAQKVARKKAISVGKAKGKVTYKLSGVSKKKFKKYFKVAAKTGKITVKKGLKKGAYTLKVKVAAAGDANHLPSAKTVKTRVKVR